METVDAIGHKSACKAASVTGFDLDDFAPAIGHDFRQLRQRVDVRVSGAFAPVKTRGYGPMYIDRRTLNNQPLDLAVQAVRDKPAFLRTHPASLYPTDPLISPTRTRPR